MPAFRPAVLALLALGSAFAQAQTAPVPPPLQPGTPPERIEGPIVPPAPSGPEAIENSTLDASLFYQLLVGELELGRGEAGSGYQVLLDAARKTGDERLFRRATEIALQAQAGSQALDAVRAWRVALPESIEAHRYEVQLLVALNRAAEAVEPLRRTLALVPPEQRASAIASLPGYFARATDRKASAAVLREALLPYAEGRIAGEPANSAVAAWVAVGRGQLTAGEYQQALAAAERAHALDPRAEQPALLAIELMSQVPQAEALARAFLEAQPPAQAATRSAVRLVYARALAVAQRYADAAPQLEAVTRDAPQFVDAWLTLGALRLELKQPQQAEAALEEYLERVEAADADESRAPAGPDEDDDAATPTQRLTQAYLLLAQAAEQRGDYARAEEWLSRVDASQALAVQVRRASLLAKQGKLEEGRALLRRLPERTPEESRARLLAEAQLLRDHKQWTAAYAVLAEANRRVPDDSDLLYEQAMMAEKLDRMDEMEQLLRRVIALKPAHPHAYNALGYSLADRKLRLSEARQLIEKAIELAPGDPFLIDSMGWVEYRLGNNAQALRWLRQAYRARPDTEIAAHLGEVLWMSGERDEARRIWTEGRSRDAGNDVLEETLARLKVEL